MTTYCISFFLEALTSLEFTFSLTETLTQSHIQTLKEAFIRRIDLEISVLFVYNKMRHKMGLCNMSSLTLVFFIAVVTYKVSRKKRGLVNATEFGLLSI